MHFRAEVSRKFETLRHQTHGTEMSWVRSVLGPKCPYTVGNSADKLRHNASVDYSVELVLLNKQQIWKGGGGLSALLLGCFVWGHNKLSTVSLINELRCHESSC